MIRTIEKGAGLRAQGAGHRAHSAWCVWLAPLGVRGEGRQIQGSGLRAQGSGLRAQGTGNS